MTYILVYFCLFLIPSYIFRFSLFGVKTNFFELAILVTFLVFIIEKLISIFQKKSNKFQFGYLFAYIFLLFAVVSVYFSADKIHALGILKGWFFAPALLYLIIINTFDQQKRRLIPFFCFFSVVLVSIWAIMQRTGQVSTLFYQVGDSGFDNYLNFSSIRSFGPFESPNYLAMFLVPMMFLSLPMLDLYKRKLDRLVVVSLFIFPLLALYFSHSLGGLLAFGAGLLTYFAIRLTKEKRSKVDKSRLKIATYVLILLFLISGFVGIFSSIKTETYSNNIRRDIYDYSLQLAKKNPVFGVGLGDFQTQVAKISADNAGFQLWGLNYAIHPHNLLLALWLNLGLGGLIAFAILLICLIKSLNLQSSKDRFAPALYASTIAILVHGFFDTTYFKNDLSMIFWLILALSLIRDKEKNEN